ncbi:MAG: histidine kinase dimerization/phospho-acceptor domain-containing protein [Deltaproteobacteria bacterium]|nr:histidine kinase dimerization/phospho-acceptor domain-containing protein [Deltaproteobacteria bacterium]
MSIELPLSIVYLVDGIGSLSMLGVAAWIFYEAYRLRRRSFINLYLFLLSCSLGTLAVSRATGHILSYVFRYFGQTEIWAVLAPVSGGVNTLIFVIIASLSFYYGIFRNLQDVRDREKERHVREVQKSRDFLQKVIDSLTTQLVVIDKDYRIAMANRKFLKDMGRSKEDILGLPCYQLLHQSCDTVDDCRKDESGDHVCPWKRIHNGEDLLLMTHVHKDKKNGEPRHIEISAFPVHGSDGEVEYMIETLTDVTDKVRLEQIQIQQEKLTGIIELASAISHELNTPMFTVLGNAQLLKREIKPDSPGEAELNAIIRNVKKMSQLTRKMTHITEYTTKDYVDEEKLFDIVEAADGQVDPWDPWQMERDQREARWLSLEKMAAMGRLTASVAHELNNAINIVLGYSQLLLRETEDGSQRQSDLKKIEKNAKQCQHIVAGLLNYTRSMAGEKAYQDVNRHLSDVLNLVAHRMALDNITIETDLSPDLRPVLMDPDEMKQVYLNLLNNAADAIQQDGRVIVRTRPDPESGDTLISFTDTGPGFRRSSWTSSSRLFLPPRKRGRVPGWD